MFGFCIFAFLYFILLCSFRHPMAAMTNKCPVIDCHPSITLNYPKYNSIQFVSGQITAEFISRVFKVKTIQNYKETQQFQKRFSIWQLWREKKKQEATSRTRLSVGDNPPRPVGVSKQHVQPWGAEFCNSRDWRVALVSAQNRNVRLQWHSVTNTRQLKSEKASLVWLMWISSEAAEGKVTIWSQSQESMSQQSVNHDLDVTDYLSNFQFYDPSEE